MRRQVVELRVDRKDTAFSIQERVGRIAREDLSVLLANLCDSAWPHDRRLRIDKLELDLGRLPERDFEKAFMETAALRFREAIEAAVARAGRNPAPGGLDRADGLDGPEEPGGSRGNSKRLPGIRSEGIDSRGNPRSHPASPARRHEDARLRDFHEKADSRGGVGAFDREDFFPGGLSPTESGLEILEYFLVTGTLPWWAASGSGFGGVDALVLEILETDPMGLRSLASAVSGRSGCILRLASQFSDASLGGWASLLISSESKSSAPALQSLQSLLHALESGEGGFPVPARGRIRFWEAIFETLLNPGAATSLAAAVEAGVTAWFPKGTVLPSAAEGGLSPRSAPERDAVEKVSLRGNKTAARGGSVADTQRVTGTRSVADGRTWVDRIMDVFPEEPAEGVPGGKAAPVSTQALQEVIFGKADGRTALGKGLEKSVSPGPTEDPLAAAEAMPRGGNPEPGESLRVKTIIPGEDNIHGGGYYPENSGLILLWPFLKAFFDDSGLLSEGGFRDDEARMRAVHLAHFLATGSTRAEEWELTLPKVLCGWPLGATLSRDVEIGTRDREESEKLLKAVIGHWSALGSISVQALRSSFLVRPGLLENTGTDWLLRVERRAFDMLLDKLPWGYSLVKLSWMEKSMRVEW